MSGSAGPADAALPLTAAERAALTACAFAIRYTEVADWLAARQRRRVTAEARAADREGWVVLEEAGEPAGDPFITYRRLEVDPATGTGVFVTTRPDNRFVTVIHEIQSAFVDLGMGNWISKLMERALRLVPTMNARASLTRFAYGKPTETLVAVASD